MLGVHAVYRNQRVKPPKEQRNGQANGRASNCLASQTSHGEPTPNNNDGQIILALQM